MIKHNASKLLKFNASDIEITSLTTDIVTYRIPFSIDLVGLLKLDDDIVSIKAYSSTPSIQIDDSLDSPELFINSLLSRNRNYVSQESAKRDRLLAEKSIDALSVVDYSIAGKLEKYAKVSDTIVNKLLSNKKFFDYVVDLNIPLSDIETKIFLQISFSTLSFSFELEHDYLLQNYLTPKVSPILFATKINKGMIKLNVKQVDDVADRIRVFKKKGDGQFSLVKEIDATKNSGLLSFRDQEISNNLIVYRAIAVNSVNGALSTTFSDYWLNEKSVSTLPQAIALQVDDSIIIELSDVPDDVSSLRVYRHDLTFGKIELLEQVENPQTKFTLSDSQLRNRHVYEYSLVLIHKNGTEKKFLTSSQIQYEKLISSGITYTTDLSDDAVVVKAQISESSIEKISRALKDTGIPEAYLEELKGSRENLDGLLLHEIFLRSERGLEHLDYAVGNTINIKAGVRKRFAIYTRLRHPDTLFDNVLKNADDKSSYNDITRIPTTYSPAKFMHPLVLSEGTLLSKTSNVDSSRYSNGGLSYGALLSVQYIDVAESTIEPKTVDQPAFTTRGNRGELVWTSSDANSIDHFMLFKEVNGKKSALGKAHAQTNSTSFRFQFQLPKDENGAFTFSLVPVDNKYKYGSEIKSDEVIIE